MLSPWRKDRILVDPFCGSGTILIEAAMMARNIAPGINRDFLSEKWSDNNINNKDKRLLTDIYASKDNFDRVRDQAKAEENHGPMELSIAGYDIDDEVLRMARANAELAGVKDDIHFQRRDVADFSSPKKYGFVITNPPYGERISEKDEMASLYQTIGDRIAENDTWSWFILSGYDGAEDAIRKKATKNRKIYNGMMKTYLYQYMGVKPPRRSK